MQTSRDNLNRDCCGSVPEEPEKEKAAFKYLLSAPAKMVAIDTFQLLER